MQTEHPVVKETSDYKQVGRAMMYESYGYNDKDTTSTRCVLNILNLGVESKMSGSSPEQLLKNWHFSHEDTPPTVTPVASFKLRPATDSTKYYSIPTVKLKFADDTAEVRYYGITELVDANQSDEVVHFFEIDMSCKPRSKYDTQEVSDDTFKPARNLLDKIEIVEPGKSI